MKYFWSIVWHSNSIHKKFSIDKVKIILTLYQHDDIHVSNSFHITCSKEIFTPYRLYALYPDAEECVVLTQPGVNLFHPWLDLGTTVIASMYHTPIFRKYMRGMYKFFKDYVNSGAKKIPGTKNSSLYIVALLV